MTRRKPPVKIIDQHDVRYLVNYTEKAIRRLVYKTGSFQSYGNDMLCSSTPHFQILDIPPSCHFKLEDVDLFEDGVIWFHLVSLEFANGETLGGEALQQSGLWGGSKLPGEKVVLKVQKVSDGKEGGLVKGMGTDGE
jgi:hypothetical protein